VNLNKTEPIGVENRRPTGKISDVFGLLKKEDSPVQTIEEINEAARRGWAGRR
jgi:hypothetical protein